MSNQRRCFEDFNPGDAERVDSGKQSTEQQHTPTPPSPRCWYRQQRNDEEANVDDDPIIIMDCRGLEVCRIIVATPESLGELANANFLVQAVNAYTVAIQGQINGLANETQMLAKRVFVLEGIHSVDEINKAHARLHDQIDKCAHEIRERA